MTGPSANLVEMKGVKLTLSEKVILEDVNFSLPKEEVLVVMGLSGCGKSTLLGILMGLLAPDSGTVHFKGDDLTKMTRSDLNVARTHIGMVFQNGALISSLTVAENVALPLEELTQKSAEEIKGIVAQKLKLVDLEDAADKLPSELSGGMQKRAGLARALALDPELVLFDEPSAGLDPINSKLIDELILKLRDEEKVTSIVVTHEMGSAFTLATRMAFLHEGKILLHGSPDEFRKSKESVISDFLSSFKVTES
ncbi:MAG: ATP-binding cassette domain-containing protein [Terrimicrobiaceae bacterium]